MRNYILKKQSPEELYVDFKIKDYLNKYLKELQRHFNVSDRKMRILLLQVYRDLKPFNFIKKIMYVKMQIMKFMAKEIKWK